MTEGIDIVAIAGKLTKAQRRAVTSATFRERDGAWHPEGWYTGKADRRVRRALVSAGLIRDYLRSSYPLNPLGQQVRSHILATQGKKAS